MAANAAKKQRPEEEAEEEMHLAFRGAANALSQVYTHAVAHQKASFLAGERRAMVRSPDCSLPGEIPLRSVVCVERRPRSWREHLGRVGVGLQGG